MSHTTFQAMVDYLANQLAQAEAAQVEQHLATCAACRRSMAFAKEFLALDQKPQPLPPASLLQRATAAFKRQLDYAQERLVQAALPSFDSWALTSASGARGAATERQLLYTLDSIDLDLQISHDPPGQDEILALDGQIMIAEAQSGELAGITIRVLLEGEERALRLTDEIGRFHVSNLMPGTYDLQVVLAEQDVVVENLSLAI